MTLPTFVIIGAMKAGTTSLWRYVRSHPDVFMPQEKEPDFFVEEKNWSRGVAWYESLFEPGAGRHARGEASTNYTKYPLFSGVPERMATVIPDARLVYIVRDPLERIRAHYLHALAAGWERRPMDRALLDEPQYVDVSSYATQIDRYMGAFPRSQLLVVTAEALRDDRAATVRRVFEFIGVDPAFEPPGLAEEAHATAEMTARSPAARAAERLPGAAVARRIVPALLRSRWRRRTTLDLDPRRWPFPPEVERRLRERLRPEVERLRQYVTDGLERWRIH